MMFGEKRTKRKKEFTGITIEKMNNGYIVGMLEQKDSRTVNLEDSYVFTDEKGVIKFITEKINTLIMSKEEETEED